VNDEADQKPSIIGDDGELLKPDITVENPDLVLDREPMNDSLLADSPFREPKRLRWSNVFVIVIVVALAAIVITGVVAYLTLEQTTTISRFAVTATVEASFVHPLLGDNDDAIRVSAITSTSIQSCQWSPNRNRLAVGNYAGKTRIWNVDDGSQFLAIDETTYRQLAWSPDGTRLAGRTSNATRIWDAETGYILTTLNPDEVGTLAHLVWSLDSTMIAAVNASNSRELSIYSAATGAFVQSLDLQTLDILEAINGVAWTQGGLFAITSNYIIRWNIETGQYEQFQQLDDTAVASDRWIAIEASDNGRYVAVSKLSGDIGEQVGQILIWDTALPVSHNASAVLTVVQNTTWGVRAQTLSHIVWAPNNSQIATTNNTGILIWDIASGENIRTITSNNIVHLDWSPDGQHMVACSAEFVRVYSVADLRDLSGD
jgi:WD40 repeat protein